MSHRYNTIDIIAGVSMCAIVFGALLFFFAVNGTYQVAIPQLISIEQPVGIELGMAVLQPALGQAIVDQALFERRANQFMGQSASEWNRATLAHHEFSSLPGKSLRSRHAPGCHSPSRPYGPRPGHYGTSDREFHCARYSKWSVVG